MFEKNAAISFEMNRPARVTRAGKGRSGVKTRRSLLWLAGAVAGVGCLNSHARAALNLQWDPSATGHGSDAAGSWTDINSSGAAIWSTAGADTAWNSSVPSAAFFGSGGSSTAYNVTLGSNISAASLTFNAGGIYTIVGTSAQTLTIGGGTINFNKTATLSNVILAGSGGLTFNGASGTTLNISDSSTLQDTLTGGFAINGGTVSFNSSLYYASGATGLFTSAQTITVNNGGTLLINSAHAVGSYYMNDPLVVNPGGTIISNDEEYIGSLTLNGATTSKGTGGDGSYQFRGLLYLNSTIATVPSATTSVVGQDLITQSGYNFILNIPQGSTSSGIDLNVTGNVSGSGGLVKNGAGLVAWSGANSYTGPTTLNMGAVSLGTTGKIQGSSGTLSALTFGGTSTLSGAAGSSANFSGTSLTGGVGYVVNTGASMFNFGPISHYTAGAVDFNGSGSTTSIITTNGAAGIIGPWATVNNGSDFAVTASNGTTPAGVSAYTGYTTASSLGSSPAGYTSTTNVLVDSTLSPSGAITPNTLKFSSAQNVTLSGTGNLIGGILIAPGTGGTNLSGGSVSAPAGQALYVSQFSTAAPLQISSAIVDTTGTTPLTGIATQNSTGITGLTSTLGLYIGEPVSGTNIPTGTVIASIPSSTSITISSAATANVSSNALTFTSGTPLVKSGAGTLQLTGANTYTAPTIINQGTISIAADGELGTAPASAIAGQLQMYGGTLSASSTMTLNTNRGILLGGGGGTLDTPSGVTLTYGGSITGSGALIKTSPGVLVLSSNSNPFAGGVTVNGGTLLITGTGGSGGVLSGSPLITVNAGATMQLSSGSSDVLGYTVGREAMTINDGTINNTGNRQTVENTITMTGGTLAGTASFEMVAATAFNATSDASGNPATVSAPIPLDNGSQIFNVSQGTAAPSVDMLVSGVISAYGGTQSLVKNGNGVLKITGISSYNGGTTVNGGTLIEAASAVFNTGVINGTVTVNSGATLAFTGANLSKITDTITVNGGGAFTLANANSSTGQGTNSNYYIGTVNLNSSNGLAAVASSPDQSALRYGYNGTSNINSYGSVANTFSQNVMLVNGSGYVCNMSAGVNNTLNVTGNIIDYAGLSGTPIDLVGPGTVVFGGNSSYTGKTNILNGTLSVSADANLGNASAGIVVNGGTFYASTSFNLSSNRTITVGNSNGGSGVIAVASGQTLNFGGGLGSGNGSSSTLNYNGPGTMIFSPESGYTGNLNINGGTFEMTHFAGFYQSGPITVNSGGTLALTAGDTLYYAAGKTALIINSGGTVTNIGTGVRDTIANPITMTGGTLTGTSGGDGNGIYSLDTSTGFVATSDAAGNPALVSGTGTGTSISLQVSPNTFQVSQGVTAPVADMVVSIPVSNYGSTPGALIKTGNGTLEFTANNTYTGGTTISAGKIQVGNGGTAGSLGTGAVVNNASLVFDVNAATTAPNNISGSGTLQQIAGLLTLSGSNTYTGATLVSSGKLYVNGSVNGSSGVYVSSGATLGGTGSVYSPVTITNGGALEAGTGGAGVLTVASLNFSGGSSTINIGNVANYTATSAINDLGAFNNNANLTFNISNAISATAGTTYLLMSYPSGSNTGTGTINLQVPAGVQTGAIINTGSEIEVTVNAVDYLNWTGATSGQWDNAISANWALNSSGASSTYSDGYTIVFGDNGSPVAVTNTTVVIDNTGSVSPGAVTFNNSNTNYTVISHYNYGINTSSALNKYGTGTVNLNTSNNFTGPVNINAGAIIVGGSNGSIGSPSSLTIASGATLSIPAAGISGTSPVSIGGNGSAGQLGALVSTGSNTFAGPLTITGATTLVSSSGTLAFTNVAAIPTAGALTLAGAGNGSIAGILNNSTGGLIMNSTGTWTLSGVNTYSGLTAVNAGTLIVNARTTGSTQAMTYNVASGATLQIGYSTGYEVSGDGFNVVGSGASATTGLYLAGGVTQWLSSGVNITTAPSTVRTTGTGNATIGGWAYTFISTTAAASGSVLSSTITLDGADYGSSISVGSGSSNSTGDLTINGSLIGSVYTPNAGKVDGYYTDFNLTGGGSILLNGVGSYSDGFGVASGTLILGGNNRLPTMTQNSSGGVLTSGAVVLGNGGTGHGTLNLNGYNQSVGSLAAFSTTNTSNTVINPSATPSLLTINYNISGSTDTYTGTLGGNGNLGNFALTKTGVGNLLLSGVSNYSGTTLITAGSITAGATNALSASSAFNVSAGLLDVSAAAEKVGGLTVGSLGTVNLSYGSILTDLGTASFNGSLNLVNTPSSVPVTLITYTSETGTFNSAIGVPTGDKLLYGSTSLQLVALGPNTLVWNNGPGGGDGATWDTVQSNWVISGTSTAAVFSNTSNTSSGDNVVFDDSTSNYNVQISGSVLPTTAVFNNSAGNYVITPGTAGAGISGPGSVTINSGSGHSVTFTTTNNYSGGTTVNSGSLILASAGAFATGPLTVASGANVTINTSSGTAFTPVVTTISNSGTIDIKNNSMVIQGGNGSTGSIAAVTAQVRAAYNGGAWNGSSGSGVITSSTAANDSTHLTAVGVITGFTGTFENTSVNSNDVLVKYTYYGDANLDGHVDGSDYSRIDNAVAMGGMTGWYNGDFNYDGVINGSDYTLIDNAYNTQGAALAGEIASPTAQIAGGISGGISAVPEPTTLGLMGLGAIGLLGRRRRR